MTGAALQMRYQLAALAKKHGHASLGSQVPVAEPPLLSTTELPILVRGVAAATTIDAARQKFAPHCFTWDDELPPLLYRHDEGRLAGRILSLAHDASGRLIITAEVSDPVAAACTSFSVGATVNAFTMVDEARPTFHALITAARCEEVSLTPTPANADCIITSRHPPCAMVKYCDLVGQGIAVIGKMAQVVVAHAVANRSRVNASARPTVFTSLVKEINHGAN
jgi:hypothetical protein